MRIFAEVNIESLDFSKASNSVQCTSSTTRMNVMRQPLLQNSLHEKRRNMSKRGLDLVTDSNGFRTTFHTNFKTFDSQIRKAEQPFESVRIRSNALERRRAALDA